MVGDWPGAHPWMEYTPRVWSPDSPKHVHPGSSAKPAAVSISSSAAILAATSAAASAGTR